MSDAAPPIIEGDLEGHGLRIGIVQSRFNMAVCDTLARSCVETLQRHGVASGDILHVRVPGAFEIPQGARTLAKRGGLDAIVCIGAVIRGETPHFDFVSTEACRGVSRVHEDYGVPTVLGILTTDDMAQALARCGDGAAGDKGAEAATVAIEMARLTRKLTAGETPLM